MLSNKSILDIVSACGWSICVIGIVIDSIRNIKNLKKDYCSDFEKNTPDHKYCMNTDLPKEIEANIISACFLCGGILIFTLFYCLKVMLYD